MKQHALALFYASRNSAPLTEKQLWAFTRLGLYRTVADSKSKVTGWRFAFAKALAHAACGEQAAAHEALALFMKRRPPASEIVRLAGALLPYIPEAALRLIDGQTGVPATLRVAALLRCGRAHEARRLLDELPPTAAAAQPELYLLRTNLSAATPAEHLDNLNAFLRAHGVGAVRLRDPLQPPTPGTAVASGAVQPARGPLVSVLMTTYRTGARAVAAAESVLAQHYRDLELIVVDDASGDDTPEHLRALVGSDPRLRFVVLPRNVGTYAAKLLGLSLARGEFVTCHDSDDWAHPEKISRQVAPLLRDKRLVCTVSNWVRIRDDGRFYARMVHPLMRLNPASPLFRRERVLREAGAWDCVRTGADSEFLARLKRVFGEKAVYKVRQPLTLGSHRPDSLMTASTTGHGADGMSPQRLAYWEAWNRWHIETLARGGLPFMPADVRLAVQSRPFAVPEVLRVSAEDLAACAATVYEEGM